MALLAFRVADRGLAVTVYGSIEVDPRHKHERAAVLCCLVQDLRGALPGLGVAHVPGNSESVSRRSLAIMLTSPQTEAALRVYSQGRRTPHPPLAPMERSVTGATRPCVRNALLDGMHAATANTLSRGAGCERGSFRFRNWGVIRCNFRLPCSATKPRRGSSRILESGEGLALISPEKTREAAKCYRDQSLIASTVVAGSAFTLGSLRLSQS